MICIIKFLSRAKGPIFVHGMIQQEHVEITVIVVVEESRLRAKTREIKTIFLCPVNKLRNAILSDSCIDQQLIFAVKNFILSNATNINIQQPIVIDVNNRDSS